MWLTKKRKFWPGESVSPWRKTLYEYDTVFHEHNEAAMAVGDFLGRRMRVYALERAARQVSKVPENAVSGQTF
jgi:hypothetical protein